ncbi:uncharacterized protein LOC118330025 isoform X1 [Morone saxatilis]|uniref:uncharacterized protein LOC118330025 isoform X1 n=1 Tax=Morone saxatilis TaxID=34816 RepID=UPI0015E1FCB4|nr:uncharacterized protein LOC118330025 isoform X1 [Morone saxatilis]
MALSVIQPIMAILRPAPESPRRIIFSWLHFAAGTVGQILAGKIRNGVCALGCCSAGAVASQPLVSCGVDWMAAVDRAGGPAAIDPLLQSQKKRYYNRPVLVYDVRLIVRKNYILTKCSVVVSCSTFRD